MIYSSWDIEHYRLKLVIMGHFLPFYPPPLKTDKIRILKKWKKFLQISSFYTSVPKTTIIWSTVPEIQSETEFFVILGHFLPSYPPPPPTPNNQEDQNFKRIKKASEDVIILQMWTKNHNHMMYAS